MERGDRNGKRHLEPGGGVFGGGPGERQARGEHRPGQADPGPGIRRLRSVIMAGEWHGRAPQHHRGSHEQQREPCDQCDPGPPGGGSAQLSQVERRRQPVRRLVRAAQEEQGHGGHCQGRPPGNQQPPYRAKLSCRGPAHEDERGRTHEEGEAAVGDVAEEAVEAADCRVVR